MLRRIFLMFAICTGVVANSSAQADEPKTTTDSQAIHQLIKPQPGESLWLQIPWLNSVWEARQRAAAEGKPIFIWAGSGGGPVGIC